MELTRYLWHKHCIEKITLDELSLETGLTRDTINRRIISYRWTVLDEVVVSERKLRQMAKTMTLREMADECFCSVGCIHRKLVRNCIPRRPRGNPNMTQKDT